MKTRLIITILIILIIVIDVQAELVTILSENKSFGSSGQIFPGEKFSSVSIFNDGTVVDMFGGTITFYVRIINSSIFNMKGGYVEIINSYDNSVLSQIFN